MIKILKKRYDAMRDFMVDTNLDQMDDDYNYINNRDNLHLARKLWHVSSGLISLLIYKNSGVSKYECAYFVLGLALTALLLDFARMKIPKLNSGFIKAWSPFLRKNEINGFSGFPFYALGAAFSLYFFEERIAVLSILFLVFSDPISSYFGIKYGTTKIRENKSLQGTAAGFVTCYLTAFAYGMYHFGGSFELLIFSVMAGAIGSFSEFVNLKVDDNLTIPVISGFGITLLNYVFNLY
jgi:diacylglycerol kinase (CTP)